MGRYAGGYGGLGGVDRDRVSGVVGVGILENHLREVERLCKEGGYGGADEAAGGLESTEAVKKRRTEARTLYA